MMRLTSREISSFLMYRLINAYESNIIRDFFPHRIPIEDSFELETYLRKRVETICKKNNAALALSGGIDSAILAKFMPGGSMAYTFKCVVPGVDVLDESPIAARYAKECGLQHKVVEIYWEDFEQCTDRLMQRKGAPIHSIEIQIYKAAAMAKEDGIETLIFGEAADAVYGGQSNILSRDWTIQEFIKRYSYIMPDTVLESPEYPIETYKRWEREGMIDPYSFMSNEYIKESVGSYLNATAEAGIDCLIPYAETYLSRPIDYGRIRRGENKYLVREVFQRLYPDFDVPMKIPMPRPMNEWLRDWEGPRRKEFIPHCIDSMNGDQKWMVWCLERFLNK